MRVGLLVAALLLASCSLHETVQPSDIAPASADAALRAYYNQLDLELPKAPVGPALPAANTVLQRIGFGSCQTSATPIPILDQITAENADLFIYLGDNVYGSGRPGNATLPNLREQYANLAALPEFQRLRQQTPMMAIWDDHDYGMGDGGGDFAFKHMAEKIFLEFWNEPKTSIRRKRDGLYDAKVFGVKGNQVQIIMLDTRFFRSSPLIPSDEPFAKGKERYLPSFDPNMTMLGGEQWRWFAEQLQQPADIRLVVTSLQVLPEDHGWEAWHNLELQRQKFFQTLQTSQAKGIIILSGERHLSAFYKKEGIADYPIYEFTASSLNRKFADKTDEYDTLQLAPAYTPHNYGMIEIDWEGRNLSLQVKGENGKTQRELQLSFSDIGL